MTKERIVKFLSLLLGVPNFPIARGARVPNPSIIPGLSERIELRQARRRVEGSASEAEGGHSAERLD